MSKSDYDVVECGGKSPLSGGSRTIEKADKEWSEKGEERGEEEGEGIEICTLNDEKWKKIDGMKHIWEPEGLRGKGG